MTQLKLSTEVLEWIPFQNLYTYFHIEKVCRAHSSAWLERPAHNRSAGGSNPLGPKLEFVFIDTVRFQKRII